MKRMIDHHFMAVRMGEQCVAKARHERLREQCAEIAKAQREEIRMMRSWLRRWYHTDHKPHLGMSERAQLRELASAKGAKYEICDVAGSQSGFPWLAGMEQAIGLGHQVDRGAEKQYPPPGLLTVSRPGEPAAKSPG